MSRENWNWKKKKETNPFETISLTFRPAFMTSRIRIFSRGKYNLFFNLLLRIWLSEIFYVSCPFRTHTIMDIHKFLSFVVLSNLSFFTSFAFPLPLYVYRSDRKPAISQSPPLPSNDQRIIRRQTGQWE